MQLYNMTRTQQLPITQDVAWAFFTNPANLLPLMPKWLAMKDESFDKTRRIYPGMIFNYDVRVYGLIPSRWVGEITHVQAPDYFIDRQHFGPFSFWQHGHHVREIEGGVEITDRVHYALPVGAFGRMAHGLFVRRQLEAMFDYRHAMLEEFFGRMPGQ